MFTMFMHTTIVHQHIVKEYQYKLPQIRPKDVIHQTLKRRRGVSKGKRYYNKLILAIMCPKCNFTRWKSRKTIKEHQVFSAFPKDYMFWNLYGEITIWCMIHLLNVHKQRSNI